MLRTLIFLLLISLPISTLAEGSLVYIAPQYRQHNSRGSCVFASITTAMRGANLWKEADEFWSKYRGPGNPQNTKARLEKSGINYKFIKGCDEQALREAINSGRMVAVGWTSRHFATLVGIIDEQFYVVDNNRPNKYIVQSRSKFLQCHRAAGGWGVIILDGQPGKPIVQDDLHGYEVEYIK